MLDTDQLRSFIAIVDTGSFTRAAERVSKTQSAVSMHIKRLEERLGKSLFHKNGRGVRLSRDGEILIEHARIMLKAEAQALRVMTGKGVTGHIRLGIPDDYADAFLADLMNGFLLHHPLVEVQVFCHGSKALTQMTRNAELDLSLVTVDKPAADVEILLEEPLRWVACVPNEIEARRPLPVALGSQHCTWAVDALAALEAAGIDVTKVLVSSNYAAIAPIIEAGLAITVFPESFIRKHHRIIPPENGLPPLPLTRVGLVVAPTSEFSGIDAMAEMIRTMICRHVA